MSSLSYKPLRKSVHLTQVSDEEILWKIQNRKAASAYFEGRKPAREFHPGIPPGSRIVSSGLGKIENILLTVPGYYDQKNPEVVVDALDESHFTTLISHLSRQERQYTVLCHATQYDTVRSWFRSAGVRDEQAQICVSVFNYSIWAQDAYVALNSKEGDTILAESICFIRDHDMTVADDLALQTDIIACQSPLYYQGGNILDTGTLTLVGMDYIRENEGRPFMETREKVIAEFAKLFGKEVLPVGREELILHRDRQYLGGGIFQPVFHLDMYVTVTGVKGKNGKELLFVGSPRLARQVLHEKESVNDFDNYFDEVAEQLEEHYEVRRMPLLPTQFKSRDSDWPRHYYLSYNNAVVENYTVDNKEHRYAYIPTFAAQVPLFKGERYLSTYYGDEERYSKLDHAAREIWEEAGFMVFQMDALEDLAMSWGSVHCIVKTLKRSQG